MKSIPRAGLAEAGLVDGVEYGSWAEISWFQIDISLEDSCWRSGRTGKDWELLGSWCFSEAETGAYRAFKNGDELVGSWTPVEQWGWCLTRQPARCYHFIPTMAAFQLTGSLPGGTYIWAGSGLPCARARNLFSLLGAIVMLLSIYSSITYDPTNQ